MISPNDAELETPFKADHIGKSRGRLRPGNREFTIIWRHPSFWKTEQR
jgi:hypothetical protein